MLLSPLLKILTSLRCDKVASKMACVQLEARLSPAVLQYELDAHGWHGEPAVILVKKSIAAAGQGDTPDLVIVSGPLGRPRVMAQAVRLATRQVEQALRIAVCHLEQDNGDVAALVATASPALYSAFDSVFVVSPSDSEQMVYRLVRTLTIPGDAPGWIGCDWNDVRHIVRSARSASNYPPARYGFGSSRGEQRAGAACAAAIAHIVRQGTSLQNAEGLCFAICAAPSVLLGKESKEVLNRLRAEIDPATAITLCMGWDDRLEPDTIEVHIFAFGTREVATDVTSSHDVPLGGGCDLAGAAHYGDPLYGPARALVLREGRASISLVQRHLRIGYQHAIRLLDAMEGDILAREVADGTRAFLPAPGSNSFSLE
jgi:hypothetical protein